MYNQSFPKNYLQRKPGLPRKSSGNPREIAPFPRNTFSRKKYKQIPRRCGGYSIAGQFLRGGNGSSLGHVQHVSVGGWETGEVRGSVGHGGQERGNYVSGTSGEQPEGRRQERSCRQPQFFQLGFLQAFRLRPSVLEPDFHLKAAEVELWISDCRIFEIRVGNEGILLGVLGIESSQRIV